MRYVVRPRNMRLTPRRLCRELGYERTYAWPNRQVTPQFDYNQDLLIACPDNVRNAPEHYSELVRLYRKNKWYQRLWLHEQGVPTPLSVEDSLLYVRRPLRHHSGVGFQVVDSESPIPTQDLIACNNSVALSGHQATYISPLFKRTHEYRIMLHKGQVVSRILKRIPEADQLRPWNHVHGSTFITVRDINNYRLRTTDIEEKLQSNPVLSTAHLLGVDVLYNNDNNTYAVCEINFAPSITIPANIEEFRNAVQN